MKNRNNSNNNENHVCFQQFSDLVLNEIQEVLNGRLGHPKEVYPCFILKATNSPRIQVVHIQAMHVNQTETERGCHALGEKFRKVFEERGYGEIEYLSFFCEAVVCSTDSEAHDKIFKDGKQSPDMDLMSQIAMEIGKSPTPGQVAKQHGVEHGVVVYLGNVPERFCGMISYKLTSDRTDISELGRETVEAAWPMDSFMCGFNGVPFDFYRNHDVDIEKLVNSPLGKQLLGKIEHLIDIIGSQRKRTVQDHLNNMRN